MSMSTLFQKFRDALAALPEEARRSAFSREAFILAASQGDGPTVESDLFAGLR